MSIKSVPSDVWGQIFSYFSQKDQLTSIILVSVKWKHIVHTSEYLTHVSWNTISEQHWPRPSGYVPWSWFIQLPTIIQNRVQHIQMQNVPTPISSLWCIVGKTLQHLKIVNLRSPTTVDQLDPIRHLVVLKTFKCWMAGPTTNAPTLSNLHIIENIPHWHFPCSSLALESLDLNIRHASYNPPNKICTTVIWNKAGWNRLKTLKLAGSVLISQMQHEYLSNIDRLSIDVGIQHPQWYTNFIMIVESVCRTSPILTDLSLFTIDARLVDTVTRCTQLKALHITTATPITVNISSLFLPLIHLQRITVAFVNSGQLLDFLKIIVPIVPQLEALKILVSYEKQATWSWKNKDSVLTSLWHFLIDNKTAVLNKLGELDLSEMWCLIQIGKKGNNALRKVWHLTDSTQFEQLTKILADESLREAYTLDEYHDGDSDGYGQSDDTDDDDDDEYLQDE